MSGRIPTLGVDFDNAGFPAQAPTPHHHPGRRVGDSHDSRTRMDWHTSRVAEIVGSYQAAAAALTYCFLTFPQVTPNKVWEIIRIGVTAPDPFTTLTGVSVLAFR